MVDGRPDYSRKCLHTLTYSALMFAKSKIAGDGGAGGTDKMGLPLIGVACINMYSMESAFYRRLNALLNAKAHRMKRLQPLFR